MSSCRGCQRNRKLIDGYCAECANALAWWDPRGADFTPNVRSWRWTPRAKLLGEVALLLALLVAGWALAWLLSG